MTDNTKTTPHSVRVPDFLVPFLERYGNPRGHQMRTDLETFYFLVQAYQQRVMGVFSVGEACLLCDALNGLFYEPSLLVGSTPSFLLVEVEDACNLNRLHEKWEVDRADLINKVKKLGPGETYAVLELVGRFWADKSMMDIKDKVRELFGCTE